MSDITENTHVWSVERRFLLGVPCYKVWYGKADEPRLRRLLTTFSAVKAQRVARLNAELFERRLRVTGDKHIVDQYAVINHRARTPIGFSS